MPVARRDRRARIPQKVVGVVHKRVSGRKGEWPRQARERERELEGVRVPRVPGVVKGELGVVKGAWQPTELLLGGGERGYDRRVHQLKQQRRSKRLPKNS